MIEYNVHYIVCFYLGQRRSNKFNSLIASDQTYFLKKHFEFLKTCGPELTHATFVINGDATRQFVDYFLMNSPQNVVCNIAIRNNVGFSYGAWNDAIVDNLSRELYNDYYFLIEDDYIPCSPDFYKPFVEKCVGKNAFVCSKSGASDQDPNGKIHVAISNGLIRGDACRKVYEVKNEVFNTRDGNSFNTTYNEAYRVQTYYYEFFEEEGYLLTDIADNYCVPFHDAANDSMVYHGKKNGEKLIDTLL